MFRLFTMLQKVCRDIKTSIRLKPTAQNTTQRDGDFLSGLRQYLTDGAAQIPLHLSKATHRS
ncbi:MAG: hypothetical protein IKB31_02870 [Bacteroidaceae bacterium]|nr:hypothetical protein [Bacteroidaceae bacterium]